MDALHPGPQNRVAGRPLPRAGYDVWYVVVQSRTSGQHLMAVLDEEGNCLQFWLRCHQPSMGALSPMRTNQPW
ncbi:hypothetical protein [Streptomyces sasae]|uniref:hypothetical protein n=1 Tax=Streptomyces sasae TaxID=1266772 RepID=UPI00374243F0